MSLIEKIASELGIDQNILSRVKYTVFDNHSAYIEGVKGVLSYTASELVLQLKSGNLIISGQNLEIKKFCIGDMAILGEINQIRKEN